MGTAADIELVALRVTAEVVVVIEEKNSSLRVFLQVEMRGCQPAEPRSHDDEIIDAAIVLLDRTPVASSSARQFVGDVERSVVIAAAELRWLAPQKLVFESTRSFIKRWCVRKTGIVDTGVMSSAAAPRDMLEKCSPIAHERHIFFLDEADAG